jgi:phosphonate transport system substrate-binding protein
VIDTLGPSPIPPWVISRQVAVSQRRALRQLLGKMHLDPAGREILANGRLLRFTAADDHDYDPIRAMAHKAQRVSLV